MELCLHEQPTCKVIFEGIFHTIKHSNIRKKQTDWGARLKETSASHSADLFWLHCASSVPNPVEHRGGSDSEDNLLKSCTTSVRAETVRAL